MSSRSFLAAAQTRWKRGCTRKQALVHMRELLTTAVRVGGVTHLVGPVTMVLQGGPRCVCIANVKLVIVFWMFYCLIIRSQTVWLPTHFLKYFQSGSCIIVFLFSYIVIFFWHISLRLIARQTSKPPKPNNCHIKMFFYLLMFYLASYTNIKKYIKSADRALHLPLQIYSYVLD